MWPMYVDYTDEECKKILRSLELEAYSSIVTAFRAQGTLTKDRKKMLLELCSALSISMERHRAEIRRAVNDEHLNTIAERLFGPNTATEWAIEGRRVVPLMNRCAPQTLFTEIANSAATAQAAKNASLPLPGKTGSREMSNGTETMASRKRKDCAFDTSVSPQKMSALDSQYFHNLLPLDNSNSGVPEPMQVPEVSMSSENLQTTETTPQITTSVTDSNTSRNVSPVVANSVSAVTTTKPSSKHPVLKSSSTVTTFSSFDQLSSNLIASRGVTQTPVPVTTHEEQVSPASEITKPPSEIKSTQRPLSSISSVKSSTIVIPTTVPSTCSASSSKDRLSTSSSTSHSKFLSQIRSSKTPGHTRQNLPAGLGIKLTPQPQMSQKATVSPKSPSLKVKQDSSNIFNKKTSTNVYPSPPVSDNQISPIPILTSGETIALSKSTLSTPKVNSKSESQTVANQQSTAKQTTVSKNLPKTTVTTTTPPSTTTHTSQYISRSLFSTSSKGGAKNLSPMIFNVATTCCTSLQTATKSTGPTQSEAGKHSPQLLPKSTAVGINPGHLKISTSNAQTIQYRKDGGLVRSARIVNISQPVGSRLPCAISSSAISALGLSTNISSTALRVTLPAGTLNTTNSIRVSSAAKPNVIVVHKAQMWPRAPQGAAVIMSSAPLTKLSNEIVQETISITQKQDKNKTTTVKPIPRAIAPARPQSPAVSITSIKASESNSAPSSNTVTTTQSDSSPSETRNSKPTENTSEAQCKRNLLADIMEASGILLENNSLDKFSKDKGDLKNKEIVSHSNHQELEITVSQKSPVSSSLASDTTHNKSSDSNTSKGDNINSRDSTLTVTPIERNGKENAKHTSLQPETQSKETVSSSNSTNENTTSSKEKSLFKRKEMNKL
ncbi:BRCA2-interacting transcriptional repressor EMSY [Trichonephila clavata]|uniref:BRCA2-interacting transcriptional repressor EMSY n=1 Tax=Trichonephila clavata TaxID=2740835 RepID=A0A8X6KTA8_TRICU|nr:BRCA2-interacting transcriptional repressor EMSY [Trichonephila clavata]